MERKIKILIKVIQVLLTLTSVVFVDLLIYELLSYKATIYVLIVTNSMLIALLLEPFEKLLTKFTK